MSTGSASSEAANGPRKLGSEWEAWSGEVEENGGDLSTSPWLFLGLLAAVLAFVEVTAWGLVFLTEPRLAELSAMFARVVKLAAMTGSIALDVMYLSIVLTVATGVNIAFFYGKRHIATSPLLPWTIRAASFIGFSRDRLSNSLLQVGNRMVAARHPRVHATELVILLPRCLDTNTRAEIKKLTEQYGIAAHICGGGSQARQILAEKKPKAIIGVACERDLMAGVQDVKGRIPVIGIANKRPEGPCRNTYIDMHEMELALRLFAGSSGRHRFLRRRSSIPTPPV